MSIIKLAGFNWRKMTNEERSEELKHPIAGRHYSNIGAIIGGTAGSALAFKASGMHPAYGLAMIPAGAGAIYLRSRRMQNPDSKWVMWDKKPS